MTTVTYIAFAVGIVLGACVTIVAMSMAIMGKLGDDPLPENQPERMHRYQD